MKKNIILRIFCLIMICCFSFVFISCGGPESPLEDEEGGELSGRTEEIENLYGVKVLYRPLTYDYDVGSGAEPGQTNDYYGKYAYSIISYLYKIYGVLAEGTLKNIFSVYANAPDVLPGNWTDTPPNPDDRIPFEYKNIPYLYDSIRYKVDTKGTVVGKVTNGEKTEYEKSEQYEIYAADLNQKWKWSFSYENSNIPALFSPNILAETGSTNYKFNNKVYTNLQMLNTVSNHYQAQESKYIQAYVGTEEKYSTFVKALEYVIYCYSLDLEPNEVIVSSTQNGEEPYSVTIMGFNSVDEALENRKELFKKAGSFVGLASRQITKIANWIKINVIGLDSTITDDYFTTCDTIYEVVNAQGDVTGFEFSGSTERFPLKREYSQAVDKIVKKVCEDVSIGKEGGGNLTVDNRFLASEVIEYAGTTFYANDDSFFPAYDPNDKTSTKIRPLEYQSVVIMPRGEKNINEVQILLKYDADMDGTNPDDGFNLDKYIDIKVELNYYNAEHKKLYVLTSEQTRVYDGAFVFSTGQYTDGGKWSHMPDDHGMLTLTNFNNCKELVNDGLLLKDEFIHLSKYDTSILPTDVADRNYVSSPYITQNPLVLLGTTDVRKYYSLIEPTADEALEENQTYITGRFNEKMVDGKCDYLEIVYKVLKDKNDLAKNYNFYTGIYMIDDENLDYHV